MKPTRLEHRVGFFFVLFADLRGDGLMRSSAALASGACGAGASPLAAKRLASRSPRASPPTAKRSAPQARAASAALRLSINPSSPQIGEEPFFRPRATAPGRRADRP
ncbi:MAG TPA: hypothetical protein VES00_12775 [Burkholderiaceae bacterium]|jgi:hypothetical protein|nr:hypothetical protein [Burkholderiaceae bacterium]